MTKDTGADLTVMDSKDTPPAARQSGIYVAAWISEETARKMMADSGERRRGIARCSVSVAESLRLYFESGKVDVDLVAFEKRRAQ